MLSTATRIARLVQAREHCAERDNMEWHNKHTETILGMLENDAPSGSGFDNGTSLDLVMSTPEKLVFHTSFHHMNDGGMYDGWTEHSVIVRASLAFGIDVRVTGRDRGGIKDYIGDVFHAWLTAEAQ